MKPINDDKDKGTYEAYSNGYKAYFNGATIIENPYSAKVQEWSFTEWADGWHYAYNVDIDDIPLLKS